MKYGNVVVILALFVLRCHCIIILDRGNPARFIRGNFMDVNQPKFTSESENQANAFTLTQQQLQTMAGSMIEAIMDNLDAFNQAMTDAIAVEAKDITPLASVNMCRFARTRMSALRIMNTFQSLRVQVASANMVAEGSTATSNIMTEKLSAGIASVAAEFVLMEQDLQHFDEGKLGDSPMQFFARAMKDFNALQTTLSGL